MAIGFSFASDWLRKWREISRPITERSKAKAMQFQITFDTQLKIALCPRVIKVLQPNLLEADKTKRQLKEDACSPT